MPPPKIWEPLPPKFYMTLTPGGEMLIGNLDVTVNDTGWVDVMNPEDNVNLGAWVRFGFGIDPDDPITMWRAYTGELTGGRLLMEVPEPASVVLLAIGGFVVVRRLRRVPPMGAGRGTRGP